MMVMGCVGMVQNGQIDLTAVPDWGNESVWLCRLHMAAHACVHNTMTMQRHPTATTPHSLPDGLTSIVHKID